MFSVVTMMVAALVIFTIEKYVKRTTVRMILVMGLCNCLIVLSMVVGMNMGRSTSEATNTRSISEYLAYHDKLVEKGDDEAAAKKMEEFRLRLPDLLRDRKEMDRFLSDLE